MKKHILIAVCGGIAAYKICDLVSKLTKKDYDVRVIMTRSAQDFVTPFTFEVLSHNHVYTDESEAENDPIAHISLARWADVALVAPATANTIAKLVHGLADNLLTSTILACDCPILLAPAMNTHMLENPITQANLALAVSFGFRVLESEAGLLACQEIGKGRLPATDVLIEFIEQGLHSRVSVSLDHVSREKIQFAPLEKDNTDEIINYARVLERIEPLKGLNVLVSAGPTVEAIDPVRYITNHSSGKQGYEIAKAASKWGANVTLVSGPTILPDPENVETIRVSSALDMLEALKSKSDQSDLIIMAAAVADYRPKTVSDEKIKKGDESLVLELVKNPDILKELAAARTEKGLDEQVICGFAMETEDLLANAQKKLTSKDLDLIVANNLKEEGAGFKGDDNIVTILRRDGSSQAIGQVSKEALGYRILSEMLRFKESKHAGLH